MADVDPPEPLLAAAAGTVGPHVAEAFATLADETRLAILLALWEEYDPHEDDPVSFSRLFDRVDYDDRGNFNYHLGKLDGRFVRKDPDGGGYELLDPGLTLVQTIIAGISTGEETFAPTGIDQPCQLCGAPMAVGYRNRHVYWECTDCSGIVPEGSEIHGFLGAVKLEPAGVAERTPAELKAATHVVQLRREGSFFDGVCPTCSGSVDAWLDACPDHASEGVCERCNRRFSTRACFQCRTCKDHTVTSLLSVAGLHPAVVAFFETHGISMRFTADDPASGRRHESLLKHLAMDVLSGDPPRVAVRASVGADEMRLTFDETVSVVERSE